MSDKMLHSDGEAIARYHEACDLMRRMIAAWEREGWQDGGETLDSVMDYAGDWLADEATRTEPS